MQLHQRAGDRSRSSLNVLAVTFESLVAAKAYVRATDLGFPVLIDESRGLYRSYGMDQGTWWNVYGLRSWWIYLKLFAKGRRMGKPQGSFRQLGGDVLIDPQGIVRMHHVANGPADRRSVESILARVQGGVQGGTVQ